MMRIQLTIVCICIGLGSTACDKSNEETTEPTKPREEVPAPDDTEGTEDQAVSTAIDDYVRCYNRLSDRTNQAGERYLNYAVDDGEFQCGKMAIDRLQPTKVDECEKAVKTAAANPDHADLARDIQAMVKQYEALAPVTLEASDYFDQEDYKDDDCTQGKAYHATLTKGFENFREISLRVADALDDVKAKLDKEDLARIEAEHGKNGEWHLLHYTMAARAVMDEIPLPPDFGITMADKKAEQWLKENEFDIDESEFVAAFNTLETAQNELDEYWSQHEDRIEDLSAPGDFGVSKVPEQSKEFYKHAKFLRRSVEAGEDVENIEHANNLIRAYSELVETANNIQFEYPVEEE